MKDAKTDYGKGIWIDGRTSKEEIEFLQELIRKAVARMKSGQPFAAQDPKITFQAKTIGGTMHIFYGWNYPPQNMWCKETKSKSECNNCFPHGIDQAPVREAWCQKMGYSFNQCPYGCSTPQGVSG